LGYESTGIISCTHEWITFTLGALLELYWDANAPIIPTAQRPPVNPNPQANGQENRLKPKGNTQASQTGAKKLQQV